MPDDKIKTSGKSKLQEMTKALEKAASPRPRPKS